MLKCRLCNVCLKPKDAQWIFLKDTNEITALGKRLMAILNVEVQDLINVSHACCEPCSFKAQNCFSLLMDVHSANAIINKMHEKSLNLESSIHAMVNTSLFECDKCDEVMTDMNSYTSHFEIHTLLEISDLCGGNDEGHEKGVLETVEFESIKTEPEDVVIIVNDGPTEEVHTSENKENYAEIGDLPPLEAAYYSSLDIKKPAPKPCKFECDICHMKLSKKFALQKHIQRRHLTPKKEKQVKEKMSYCKYCSIVIPKGEFRKHTLACRSELLSQGTMLCDFCGKSMRAESLKSHLAKHRERRKGGVHICSICQKSCSTRAGLNTHLILHDQSKYIVCEVCGLRTPPRLMWKHLKKHKDKENICEICGKAFMFNYLLQTHKKIHEKNPSIGVIGVSGKGHKCPKCDKEYTFTSMLNIHLREEHNDPGLDLKSTFPCKECDKTFDDKFSLKNHLSLMHNATKEDLAGISRGNIVLGVFHCPECNRVLQSDFGLRQHLRIVHNLKNKDMPSLMRRQCEKCNKTFADKQTLLVHIKAVHLKIADIRCNLCNKTFKRYQSLVNHKLQHTGSKPFECEVCNKTFRQRVDTMRHLQRHVRDGDVSIDEAVARNNSESSKLRKNRIFLKESKWGQPSDIWGTTTKKRKIEVPEVETIVELE